MATPSGANVPETTIDIPGRQEYARILRRFVAGRYSNHEYEHLTERFESSDDDGIRQVWWAAWHLYDDFHRHTLTDEWKLPRTTRRDLARCILFLYTDLKPRETEFRQGCWLGIGLLLAAVAIFGLGLWLNAEAMEIALGLGVPLLVVGILIREGVLALLSRVRNRSEAAKPASLIESLIDDPAECWPFPSVTALAAARSSRLFLAGRTVTTPPLAPLAPPLDLTLPARDPVTHSSGPFTLADAALGFVVLTGAPVAIATAGAYWLIPVAILTLWVAWILHRWSNWRRGMPR